MKWGRILVAGIGTQAAVLLVITLVVTGYAFKLAFEVQGAPDQTRIGQFAEYLGRSFSWVLQILLTVPAAAWAVRKVQSSHQLDGVLIGLVVAVTGFVMGFAMSFRTIAEFALTVGAGWLGGAMAAHHRMKQDRGRREARLRMQGYYSRHLSGDRLQQCYELASTRVMRYLEAEIEFVLSRLRPTDSVLELGCGYGRVTFRLAEAAAHVVGIDTSSDSLILARHLACPDSRSQFLEMDASALTFRDGAFDVVVCVQNGICAFSVNPERLVREALRVTRPGGRALFSTYSPAFWPERLRWFESQAAAGLVGAIDYEQTKDGTVVCKDGFRAGTFSAEAFHELCRGLGVEPAITTVDDSSVFCEVVVPSAA